MTGFFEHKNVINGYHYTILTRYLHSLQNGIYKGGGGAPVGSGAPVVHSKEAAFD